MKLPYSFAFFGTPDVAEKTLRHLIGLDYRPTYIVTNPARPVGRKHVLTDPPVALCGHEYAIPVFQPETCDQEFIDTCPPVDLFIVIAYGHILKSSVIETPRYGTINVHYSLLPRWRGASPVEAALLAGDTVTGVSIQKMVPALDAGPLLASQEYVINEMIEKPALLTELTHLGAHLLGNLMPHLPQTITESIWTEQDPTGMTLCKKIKKEDGEIFPATDDGRTVWNKYRAYQGWPCIYYFEHGKRYKVTRAERSDTACILTRVIPEGQSEQSLKLVIPFRS
jgi:methionyl-tRNA formyltransferase